MAFNRIEAPDLEGRGVVGQADVPGLSALEMQHKVEELARQVIIPHFNQLIDQLTANGAPVQSSDVMLLRIGENGDLQISPDGESWHNVADTALAQKADKDTVYTKAEVDTAIGQKVEQLGAGDMAMIMYDSNFNGIVDDTEKFGGQPPEYYATKTEVNSALTKANGAMPVAGGTFTGAVTLAGAPTADLNPATKQYVDSHTANTSNPHSVTKSQVGLGNVTNNEQMPITGGTFTGNAIAYETARTTRSIFNNETRASSTTGTLQSVKYFIDVT